MPRTPGRTHRLVYLDLVRFLAALLVLLFHFHAPLGTLPPAWVTLPSVDLFFVLSGMVLGAKYGPGILAQDVGWQRFAWHRVRRLYPAFFLAGLVLTALALAGVPPATVLESRDSQALGRWLLLPCVHGCDVSFPGNPPTWSLFVELAANAAWFALLAWMPRLLLPALALSAAVFLGAAFHTGIWHLGWSPGVLGIGLGVARACCWFLLGYLLRQHEVARHWPVWALLAAFSATVALHMSGALHAVNPALSILLIALTGSLLLARLVWLDVPSHTRFARACIWLGGLSYPLYLNQAAAGRLGEFLWRQHGLAPWVGFVLLPIGLGIVMAWVYDRLVAPWLEPRLYRIEF